MSILFANLLVMFAAFPQCQGKEGNVRHWQGDPKVTVPVMILLEIQS